MADRLTAKIPTMVDFVRDPDISDRITVGDQSGNRLTIPYAPSNSAILDCANGVRAVDDGQVLKVSDASKGTLLPSPIATGLNPIADHPEYKKFEQLLGHASEAPLLDKVSGLWEFGITGISDFDLGTVTSPLQVACERAKAKIAAGDR